MTRWTVMMERVKLRSTSQMTRGTHKRETVIVSLILHLMMTNKRRSRALITL